MDPIQALGWSLLHFLWQGALIAAVLGVALAVLHRASPQARYLTACAALTLMVVAPAVTIGTLVLAPSPDTAGHASAVAARAVMSPPATPTTPVSLRADEPTTDPAASPWGLARGRQALERGLPWIVALWILGSALSLLRLGVGWLHVVRLRRSATAAVAQPLQRAFDRLTRQLEIRRPVRLVRSVRAAVPTVTGWLRPVVIVPASAMTGLSPEQLEAILAHELAHVRRHDYLVNVFQAVVESLLFYHPAVWWVSKQMRRERENCCDDVAVGACGDAVTYARALTALEAGRLQAASPALAATGGSLLARIRRLAHEEVPSRTAAAPAMVVAALLCAAAVAATQSRADAAASPSDPGRSGTHVSRSDDGHEVRYRVQNADRNLEVRLIGEVTFDRDLTSIESLSPGGRLWIHERRRGERELQVLPEGTRGLAFEYRLEGRVVSFDGDGQRWLAELIPTLVRSGGVGAKAHARRLVAQGVRRTLDEIDRLESNGVRAIFYEELLIRGNLSESETSELAQRAARDISSNSTLAGLYAALATHDRLDGGRIVELAAASIDSNSTLASLLLRLVGEDKITPVAALEAMEAAIDSQSTRASLVLELAGAHGRDGRVRSALMDSLRKFDSNSTLAQLLTDLESRRFLTPGESLEVATERIDSNSTLAAFLRVRAEDGRLGAEEALELGARHIDSDSTYAELVYAVAAAHRDEAGLEALLDRYLREISSKSTRERLVDRLDGLLGKGAVSGPASARSRRVDAPAAPAPATPASLPPVPPAPAEIGGRVLSDSERASLWLRRAAVDPGDGALAADLERELDRIASNSVMASLLLGLEEAGTLDAARVRELAAQRIASNSTHASLLKQLLERGSATPDEVLRDASRLASESTRASLLLHVVRADDGDPRTAAAVMETLRGFASNSTLASLLLRLDEVDFMAAEDAVALAAQELESNSTLASYLRSVQQAHPSDRDVRAAITHAYGAMASHSTLANALEGAMSDDYFDAVEALAVAAASLRDWDGISRSGVWNNGVQVESYPDPLETFVARLAERHRHDGAFRRAYIEAADSMQTLAVRQRLLQYLSD